LKSFNIVLVEPEIPPNTGNIARTCALTGTKLHLVKPLGFSIDEKTVRRAGLDYWSAVDIEVHESIEDFLRKYTGCSMYFATTKTDKTYADVSYEEGSFILFGKETKGLSPEILSLNKERNIRIPMNNSIGARSLNLSNSVNIILYEALRQYNFAGLI